MNRTIAAARALCRQASAECNVDADDNWQQYSKMFMDDAKAALKAADGILDPNEKLVKQVAALQEQVKFYREKYGILDPNEKLVKQVAALQEQVKFYREKYGILGGTK